VLRERPPGLIEKLHLLDGKYLKRAAVLLFHPDPELFIAGAFVKVGYFRTNVDLLYHDEIHGDLFTQVSGTMDLLLTKYLKAGISYKGVQRVESLPVPEAALREAVLNAILHKDYSSGTPVQVSVYADKLMLWNPGELPQDWTVARLKAKHPSHPFNPCVAMCSFAPVKSRRGVAASSESSPPARAPAYHHLPFAANRRGYGSTSNLGPLRIFFPRRRERKLGTKLGRKLGTKFWS